MNTKPIFFLLFVITTVLFALSSAQSIGPHGGVMKRAQDYYIEMRSSEKVFYGYLLDKNMKAISSTGVSGEAQLFLPDSTTFDIRLKPRSGDVFISEEIPAFYACKIIFHVSGAEVTAEFENKNHMPQKNN